MVQSENVTPDPQAQVPTRPILFNAPSPRLLGVLQALRKIAKSISIDGIDKAQRNKDQNYNFRGIDDVMDALSPLMADSGIIAIPSALSREQQNLKTQKGTDMFKVVVKMRYDFTFVEDGSFVRVEMYGEANDTADKATNKAESAAYKYAFFQLLCIPLRGSPGEQERPEDREADFRTPDTGSGRPPAPREPVDTKQQAEEERRAAGPETIHEALKRLVKNEKERESLTSKIQTAYSVALLDQIPDDKVAEAILKAEKFVSQQKARRAK